MRTSKLLALGVCVALLCAICLLMAVSQKADAMIGSSSCARDCLVSSRPHEKRSDVLIIMGDSRRPEIHALRRKFQGLEPPDDVKHPFSTLSFAINSHYASAHGYDFAFFHYAKPTCLHPKHGKVHLFYCKVLACAWGLKQGYKRVLWMDSDTYFNDETLSLKGFLDLIDTNGWLAAPETKTMYSSEGAWPSGADKKRSAKTLSLLVPTEGDKSNVGIFLLSNNGAAKKILKSWWEKCQGKGPSNDYDQGYFNEEIMRTSSLIPHIGRIASGTPTWHKQKTSHYQVPKSRWVNHLTSKTHHARHRVMTNKLMELLDQDACCGCFNDCAIHTLDTHDLANTREIFAGI